MDSLLRFRTSDVDRVGGEATEGPELLERWVYRCRRTSSSEMGVLGAREKLRGGVVLRGGVIDFGDAGDSGMGAVVADFDGLDLDLDFDGFDGLELELGTLEAPELIIAAGIRAVAM